MRGFLVALVVVAAAIAVLFWRLAASGGVYGLSGIEVPADKNAYVGAWTAPGYVLSIEPSGKVHYERHEGNAEVTLNAPIQKFVRDDFLVGALFWTTTFHVTAPPHQEDKVWRMTSDGVNYSHP
jgi:hypothetical protein